MNSFCVPFNLQYAYFKDMSYINYHQPCRWHVAVDGPQLQCNATKILVYLEKKEQRN